MYGRNYHMLENGEIPTSNMATTRQNVVKYRDLQGQNKNTTLVPENKHSGSESQE